jgi:three-Cys-motif partner protein
MNAIEEEFAYGFHTLKKAKLVGIWYKICIEVEKFKEKKFNIIDLYAGDGFSRHRTPDGVKQEWGPPLRAISMIVESQAKNVRCAFNDREKRKIEKLEKNLMENINGFNKKEQIIGFFHKDANIVYNDLFQFIDARNHNLFFLDPQKHGQLHWNSIEDIVNFSINDTYKNNSFIRRPELLINFMTYTMQKNYKTSEKVRDEIDKSLGVSRQTWMKKVKECEINEIPVYRAFLDIFIEKLNEYYPKEKCILPFPVSGVQSEGPIYFLILASTHPMAHKITFNKFDKYITREFKEVDHDYRKELARMREGKLITDYF